MRRYLNQHYASRWGNAKQVSKTKTVFGDETMRQALLHGRNRPAVGLHFFARGIGRGEWFFPLFENLVAHKKVHVKSFHRISPATAAANRTNQTIKKTTTALLDSFINQTSTGCRERQRETSVRFFQQ